VDQKARQLEARLADTVSADAVAALEKRQAELEATIAALQTPEQGQIQQQMDDLKTQIAALQTQFADFAVPGLDELVGRLDAIEASVEGIGATDIGALQTALASLETSVQGLQTQIGDLAPQRVDDLSGRLDTLEQQVASLDEPDSPELAGRLDSLNGRLSGVEATVAEIAAGLPEGLQGRLDELAGRLAVVTVPDIGAVEARLGTAETDIATLRTGVDAAATKEQLSAVETRVADLDTQLTASGAGMAGVQSETTRLSAQIGELVTALATKADTAEVTTLAGQIDALEVQLADLPTSDASTFEAGLATLRSDLDTLAARVAELPPATEIATLKDDLRRIVSDPPRSRPPQLIERIYFGSSSTSVGDEELAKIDAVARRLAASPVALELVGFSDSQGPAELNRSLSLRRAAAVRLALLEHGVDSAAVTSVTGLGEDAPPVDAGDDADEANNRVVLIYSR
jgi:outer membrane protein OmpA-like peptidoglycan-associated protein